MVGSFLAPKWPIMVPFCGMDHQKSNFLLISDTHSAGGCWGQLMLLFWKLDNETQMGNPRDHAVRDILPKFSIFLPLRAILKNPYHYETPCTLLVLFNPIWHWGNTFINVNCLKIADQQPEKLSTKLFKKVSLNFPMKLSQKLFTKFTSKLSQKLSLNCPRICSKNSQ